MADQGGNEGYFTYGMPPSQMMDFSRQTGPNNYSGQDVKPMLFPQYEGHANGTQNTALMAHSGYQQNAQREGIVGQPDNSQREMMQHMLTSHQVHQQAQLAAIEPHRPSSSSAGAEGGAGMAATGGTDDSSENGAYTPKSHHIGGSQPFPLTTSMSSLSITPGSAAAPIGTSWVCPAEIAQASKRPSRRSKKKPIPEEKKDERYKANRSKNNLAAKKSREKTKMQQITNERRVEHLQIEISSLEGTYAVRKGGLNERHQKHEQMMDQIVDHYRQEQDRIAFEKQQSPLPAKIGSNSTASCH